ncbi:MAG TPA: Rrf2 family transcriptional regulator [Bacteroidales bacterium]|nr:Rrf2 family transcriptional regulator [Bacteroidales bacterium]
MKISTRTRYGLRTMVEIAGGSVSQSVFQKDIARNQNLSNKYLDQIIHALKTANLIHDAKGKKSGYLLTRSPKEITVFDIHRAFDPGICLVDCLSGNFTCEREAICQARDFWKQLNRLVNCYLKSVTLEDIINGKVGLDDVGFYENIKKCDGSSS